MTVEQLHEHCEALQQMLIDLIAAVQDLQGSREWEHLQDVIITAEAMVQDDIPPLSAAGA